MKKQYKKLNARQRVFLDKVMGQVEVWLREDSVDEELVLDGIDSAFDVEVVFGKMELNDASMMKYQLRKFRRVVDMIL
jgi:hypothetical protein